MSRTVPVGPLTGAGSAGTDLDFAAVVENAVQHGISSIEEGGIVEISASRKGEFLELQVHVTGRRQGEARPAHCGVGLPNVNPARTTLRQRLPSQIGSASCRESTESH